MAIGLGEKIERKLTHWIVTDFGASPWKQNRKSHKWDKTRKHRRERRRATVEPDCQTHYRRYFGFEW